MPFKPFHAGSTTVPKKAKLEPKGELVTPAKALRLMKNISRTPKPSGAGPRGSAGYFDN